MGRVYTARMPGRGARDLGPDDLILSHFSLRYADFDERVEAAGRAGFAGIGLLIPEYERLRAGGRSDGDLGAVLEKNGVVLAEIEALFGWAGSGEARDLSEKWLDTALHLGHTFGARHLQAVGPYEGSLAQAAAAFGEVCDRAASAGLRVALEYLPIHNPPDARTALELVERAGRENGGLCLDTWHHFRGDADFEVLGALPSSRVVSVQVNDGTRVPENADYLADTLENRRPPGEGEFELDRFAARLRELGVDTPLSVEVISGELQKLPARATAVRLAAATRKTFGLPATTDRGA